VEGANAAGIGEVKNQRLQAAVFAKRHSSEAVAKEGCGHGEIRYGEPCNDATVGKGGRKSNCGYDQRLQAILVKLGLGPLVSENRKNRGWFVRRTKARTERARGSTACGDRGRVATMLLEAKHGLVLQPVGADRAAFAADLVALATSGTHQHPRSHANSLLCPQMMDGQRFRAILPTRLEPLEAAMRLQTQLESSNPD
jgi:hypothetical protein